jgi:hypothetical protein
VAKILAECRKKAKIIKGIGNDKSLAADRARVQAEQAKILAREARNPSPEAIKELEQAGRVKALEQQVIGKSAREAADKVEKRVARYIGGTRLTGYQPGDVSLRTAGLTHKVEVKAKLSGKKRSITMHPDALHRKILEANGPNPVIFHTVVLDLRDKYEGGIHADRYSGHPLYYKRGAGPYSLSKMYRVTHPSQIRELMEMSDDELPELARGSLKRTPEEIATSAISADKAHKSRVRKQAAYKKDLESKGLSRHKTKHESGSLITS